MGQHKDWLALDLLDLLVQDFPPRLPRAGSFGFGVENVHPVMWDIPVLFFVAVVTAPRLADSFFC